MAREIEKPLLRELAKAAKEYDKRDREYIKAKDDLDAAASRYNKALHDRDSIARAIMALRGQKNLDTFTAPVVKEAEEFVAKEVPVA